VIGPRTGELVDVVSGGVGIAASGHVDRDIACRPGEVGPERDGGSLSVADLREHPGERLLGDVLGVVPRERPRGGDHRTVVSAPQLCEGAFRSVAGALDQGEVGFVFANVFGHRRVR